MRRLVLAAVTAGLLLAGCGENRPYWVDNHRAVITDSDGRADLQHAYAACQTRHMGLRATVRADRDGRVLLAVCN